MKGSSFDAEAIGVSPIKKVSFRDKISYGRNKLKRIKVDIEEKVAQALDISAEELQPETQVENSKCNDLYKLVGLIKEKLLVSSWNEKVKLLTLTPESWTIEKTMKEFEVSKYLVKKARSLKKELGILAEPKAKTDKVLPQETVTTVFLFRLKKKIFHNSVFLVPSLTNFCLFLYQWNNQYIDQCRATMIRIKFAKF